MHLSALYKHVEKSPQNNSQQSQSLLTQLHVPASVSKTPFADAFLLSLRPALFLHAALLNENPCFYSPVARAISKSSPRCESLFSPRTCVGPCLLHCPAPPNPCLYCCSPPYKPTPQQLLACVHVWPWKSWPFCISGNPTDTPGTAHILL